MKILQILPTKKTSLSRFYISSLLLESCWPTANSSSSPPDDHFFFSTLGFFFFFQRCSRRRREFFFPVARFAFLLLLLFINSHFPFFPRWFAYTSSRDGKCYPVLKSFCRTFVGFFCALVPLSSRYKARKSPGTIDMYAVGRLYSRLSFIGYPFFWANTCTHCIAFRLELAPLPWVFNTVYTFEKPFSSLPFFAPRAFFSGIILGAALLFHSCCWPVENALRLSIACKVLYPRFFPGQRIARIQRKWVFEFWAIKSTLFQIREREIMKNLWFFRKNIWGEAYLHSCF